jgi:hypothetical protein
LQLEKVDGITLQLPEAKKNPGLQVSQELPSNVYERHPDLTVVGTQVVVKAKL